MIMAKLRRALTFSAFLALYVGVLWAGAHLL